MSGFVLSHELEVVEIHTLPLFNGIVDQVEAAHGPNMIDVYSLLTDRESKRIVIDVDYKKCPGTTHEVLFRACLATSLVRHPVT